MEEPQFKSDGSTFNVRPKEAPYLPNLNQLQHVPAQDSPKNILNALNDDCLCHIFDKISHLADIHSISNVCKRFNTIAQIVFPTKISSRWINFDDMVFDDGTPFHHISLDEYEGFLSTFGSSIKSLKFRPYYFVPSPNLASQALKLIQTFCKNIRNLDIEIGRELKSFRIPNELRSILSQLKSLHIRFVRLDLVAIVNDFISACSDIEELNVYADSACNFVVIPKIFSKLTKFNGHNVSMWFGPFFEMNSQLEEIEIGGWVRREDIRTLWQNMANLKKFQATTEIPNIIVLGYHGHLTINLDGVPRNTNIDQTFLLQSITEVAMHKSYSCSQRILLHDLLWLAEHFPNLERMKIYTGEDVPTNTMKQMLQHASKLSEFYKRSRTNGFNVNDYNEILNVVQARECKIKLNMILDSSIDTPRALQRNEFYKKLEVFNEHPDLVVYKYEIQQQINQPF